MNLPWRAHLLLPPETTPISSWTSDPWLTASGRHCYPLATPFASLVSCISVSCTRTQPPTKKNQKTKRKKKKPLTETLYLLICRATKFFWCYLRWTITKHHSGTIYWSSYVQQESTFINNKYWFICCWSTPLVSKVYFSFWHHFLNCYLFSPILWIVTAIRFMPLKFLTPSCPKVKKHKGKVKNK